MQILIDTGILLRALDQNSPERLPIFAAFKKLWAGGHQLATAAQNIAEFWNVATRPAAARGGYGLPIPTVELRVRSIERMVTVLPFSEMA